MRLLQLWRDFGSWQAKHLSSCLRQVTWQCHTRDGGGGGRVRPLSINSMSNVQLQSVVGEALSQKSATPFVDTKRRSRKFRDEGLWNWVHTRGQCLACSWSNVVKQNWCKNSFRGSPCYVRTAIQDIFFFYIYSNGRTLIKYHYSIVYPFPRQMREFRRVLHPDAKIRRNELKNTTCTFFARWTREECPEVRSIGLIPRSTQLGGVGVGAESTFQRVRDTTLCTCEASTMSTYSMRFFLKINLKKMNLTIGET